MGSLDSLLGLRDGLELLIAGCLIAGRLALAHSTLKVSSAVLIRLLHVLLNDQDANVRDAAYGTLVRLARMQEQQAVA